MGSNTFGNLFKMTTWGESHGKAIGVVIDGCPANIPLDPSVIDQALLMRAPGRSAYTSPRKEIDQAEIVSGVFEGKTTGAPISILIPNKDADSSKYEPIKNVLRPGHANYTYLEKYGIFDYRGGGRASARETAGRVAAGAIAKKFLEMQGIQTIAYIKQIGSILAKIENTPQPVQVLKSSLFCPDNEAETKMQTLIDQMKGNGDSVGGTVEFQALFVPPGLGDPIYEKLEARLAFGMLSIPAAKGFEIGSGFEGALMQGSSHNDLFIENEGIKTKTNFAGGILGGISTGMPIIGKVAFKPASSLFLAQETLTTDKKPAMLKMPEGSRHDPCVAIRAVPVVEAMLALVLADSLLLNRSARA